MRNHVFSKLKHAAQIGQAGDPRRHFRLGAVGIRKDGKTVSARNSPTPHRNPKAHAEARLARKLTPDSIVFVSRNLHNGDSAMSKPCKSCQRILKSVGVKKVYYTTDYGFEVMSL